MGEDYPQDYPTDTLESLLKILIEEVRKPALEETVLWKISSFANQNGTTFNLADSMLNYDYIRFHACHYYTQNSITLETYDFSVPLKIKPGLGVSNYNGGYAYLFQYASYCATIFFKDERTITNIGEGQANYTIINYITGLKYNNYKLNLL